jgi:hypothetical protein
MDVTFLFLISLPFLPFPSFPLVAICNLHLFSYAGEAFDDVSMDSAVAFIMMSLYLGMDDARGKYYASMAYNILKVSTFVCHTY